MNIYQGYVASIKALKEDGINYEEVLDYLEFDSDEYPEQRDLESARDEVYGKPTPLIHPEAFAGILDAIVSNADRDRRYASEKLKKG